MMDALIEFHPGTFADFFEPIDRLYPALSSRLANDFKRYIDSNRSAIPLYFGRDAPYLQPAEAERVHLSHVHIKLPPEVFRQDVAQYYRVCSRDPAKDAALVYVQGWLEEERYLLLAFLWPGAHEQAREQRMMRSLARLAADWREKH